MRMRNSEAKGAFMVAIATVGIRVTLHGQITAVRVRRALGHGEQ